MLNVYSGLLRGSGDFPVDFDGKIRKNQFQHTVDCVTVSTTVQTPFVAPGRGKTRPLVLRRLNNMPNVYLALLRTSGIFLWILMSKIPIFVLYRCLAVVTDVM